MLAVKVLLLITSTVTTVCHVELVDGPLNITRTTGESLVVIPCPFTGQYQIVWKINNVVYEMFDLPYQYGTQFTAISSGLLIPHITEEFEGKSLSFQCFYPKNNDLGFQASTIGTMIVMKQSIAHDVKRLLSEGTQLTFVSEQEQSLAINHQQLFFESDNKIFAWKTLESNEATCMDMYRVVGRTGCTESKGDCERQLIHEWRREYVTNVTIRADDLLNNNTPVQFNIFRDFDGDECFNVSLKEKFQLNKNVNTEELKTATSGKISLNMYTSSNLVIPSEDDNSLDCLCPYFIIENATCFNFTSCGCIERTSFHKSNSELRVCRMSMSMNMLSLQISNITNKLNNTKLHIYESYRICSMCSCDHCPYRNYVRSLVLIHVLPERPEITDLNNHTLFCFVSQKVEGISLDFYEVNFTDITREVLYTNITYEIDGSCIDTEDLTHDHFNICSPFSLSVKAINKFGSSVINSENITEGSHVSDVCQCLYARTRAFIYLNVTPEELTILAEIIEEQSNIEYVSDLEYEIRLSECYPNETNVTTYHNESIRIDTEDLSASFENLICQRSYCVQLWWISKDNYNECFLGETITSPSCPENNRLVIIISTAIGGCSLIIIGILVAIIMLCIRTRLKHDHNSNNNSQGQYDRSSDTYGSTGTSESLSSQDGNVTSL